MNDEGFAVVGSAVIIALAVFMGFGAAVIVQRGHLLHQARLTQQRISRSAHEGLTVSVNRGSDSTDITIANDGSSTVIFNHLLLKQPGYGVVVVPSDGEFFNDLAGWWRFSGGAGVNAYDYSGSGNDGVLYGDPTWVDGWVGDGALEFDGSGDYVAIQNLHYDTPGEIGETTVFSRIRSSSSQEQIIAAFDRSEYWRLALMDDVNPYVGWDTHSPSYHHDLGSSSSYVDGKSHPVVGWFKSGASPDKKIFVDGEEVAQATAHGGEGLGSGATRYGFIGVGSEASSFNGSTGPNNWFKGVIDEVMFFNRALSPGEISELSKCNVLLYPVSLTPLESYTVTYPFRVDNQATVGVYTQLGNIFWEEVS